MLRLNPSTAGGTPQIFDSRHHRHSARRPRSTARRRRPALMSLSVSDSGDVPELGALYERHATAATTAISTPGDGLPGSASLAVDAAPLYNGALVSLRPSTHVAIAESTTTIMIPLASATPWPLPNFETPTLAPPPSFFRRPPWLRLARRRRPLAQQWRPRLAAPQRTRGQRCPRSHGPLRHRGRSVTSKPQRWHLRLHSPQLAGDTCHLHPPPSTLADSSAASAPAAIPRTTPPSLPPDPSSS